MCSSDLVAYFASALEQTSQRSLAPTARLASEESDRGQADATGYDTVAVAPCQPMLPTESTPSADLPMAALEPTVYPGSSAQNGFDTPQSGAVAERAQQGQGVAPTAAVVSPPLEPTMPVQRKARRLTRTSASLLIGLVFGIILIILSSLSLLAYYGMIGARSGATTPVRGGTWTLDYPGDPVSLIPNGDPYGISVTDEALYLPLFYGDAQGVVHPGSATEVPTLQNGGISPDAKTWTIHLRPHLLWSDGQPYDARDVDYTWKLWLNPKFSAYNTQGLNLITRADVSADHLSISFHLKQSYVPFLQDWVDGIFAPLPAHHFSSIAPEGILKSPDNLNPQITSGPFMMSESKPGDHYTLVRNPNYYRASEGLPYLDKVVFRITDSDLKDLQAGTIDTAIVDPNQLQMYQRFTDYTLIATPTSNSFEALWFNFHNTVLASHLEVRQAIDMAIDHQALIAAVPGGFATRLCTDHPSAMHPGYEPPSNCQLFDTIAANKLLDDSGWMKGADGIRAKGGQRLEFEYSTSATYDNIGRASAEVIIQRNLQAIGIKLDIQNYQHDTFFNQFLPAGKASPPTGAVAGRYDIAQFAVSWGYDPDDAILLSCDQPPPPKGGNLDFYCNPTLDALYAQEQATADPGVRQQIFNQIHHIYLTVFPFIVLYSTLNPSIVRKGTHNYQPSTFEGETVNIWEWWCDGGKC